MKAQTKLPLVLHLSDDPETLDLVATTLKGAGIEVLQARDGVAGLAAARQEVPELVLLDLRLARVDGVDGYRITRLLRADAAMAGVPVVHTSAGPDARMREAFGDSFDAGADACLATPLDALDLLNVVRPLVRLRLAELAASRRAETLRIANEKKDEFMAMLGHELRNPLNAVRLGLSVLENGTLDAGRAANVRATVSRQTERLVRLVDDLLDVARIAQGKLRLEVLPVDLREVVARSVDVARPSFERLGVSLFNDTGHTGAVIDGDPGRLEQIVGNLLDNALKYTPAGGRVDVTVTVVDETRRARLRVKDSGVGIDKSNLEQGLFGLFAQGDTSLARREGGLGIGLSVVHRLVEMHGGTAVVSSAGLGLGTAVTIDLPLLSARSGFASFDPG